jgi:transcriptional regulator with XRE-family HTH domain
MNIGARVRGLRKGRSMTQIELARELEVDQVYVSRIESGRLKNVKPEVVKKLAEIFNVSIEYIIVGVTGESWQYDVRDEPIRRFLSVFLRLDSEKQALVMDFTDMLARKSTNERDKATPQADENKGSSEGA